MTTSERRGYYNRRFGTSAPRPENPVYGELDRYAGELLTIESITIGILASKFTATVRYDENTVFEINVYKPEQELLLQAGYDIPSAKGTHPFHADVTCKFDKVPHTREWDLFIVTVAPQAGGASETPQPTPLQAQSAIYWLLKYDSHLQKLVHGVTMHHDIHGNPIVRIQVKSIHKAEVESVVNPMATGVAILWSIIEHKAFYGVFVSAVA